MSENEQAGPPAGARERQHWTEYLPPPADPKQYTQWVLERVHDWYEDNWTDLEFQDPAEIAKTALSATEHAGIHARELHRLRLIEQALVECGAPSESRPGEPGAVTIEWIRLQAGLVNNGRVAKVQLSELQDRFGQVMRGADPMPAKDAEWMSPGQFWHRLTAADPDLRMVLLSAMLDMQRVGSRCLAEIHDVHIQHAHDVMERNREQLRHMGTEVDALAVMTLALGMLAGDLRQQTEPVDPQEIVALLNEIGHGRTYEQARAAVQDTDEGPVPPGEQVPAEGDDVEPAAVADMLALVGVEIHPDWAAAITPEQRVEAFAWAGAVHLSASDNLDVEIPPRPEFLPRPKGTT